MTALLLRLASPLQSWGTASRFARRNTDRIPSKSGIIGLLAAAQGRRRTDPLEELLNLRIAVRTEQSGRVERDFQTASGPDGGVFSLSYRQYLADAVFLAAVEGERGLLESLQQALHRPHFPLYLGRRSCPPVGRVEYGLREGDAVEVLRAEPWQASTAFQRSWPQATALLDLVADCPPGTPGADLVRDEPITFDPRHRQWEWRSVLRHDPVRVANPSFHAGDRHDPMAVL